MGVNFSQELHNICCSSIVVEQRVVKPESFRPRRAGKGRQRRDSVVSVPGMLQRRFSNRSPHAPSQWLKQIATFVQKNQASLTFKALFLAAAIRRGATERWPVRLVLGRVARASVNSSQVCGEGCPRSPHGTRRQTVGESGLGLADMSNPKASNPNGWCPFSAQAQGPCTVCVKASGVGHDADGHVTIYFRHASTFPSNGMPRRRYTRPQQPLPSAFSLARKAGLRSFDELPAPRDFLMVSSSQLTEAREIFH